MQDCTDEPCRAALVAWLEAAIAARAQGADLDLRVEERVLVIEAPADRTALSHYRDELVLPSAEVVAAAPVDLLGQTLRLVILTAAGEET